MVETSQKPVSEDLRTDEEKNFDSASRSFSAIIEPMNEKDNPDALFANGWGRRGHFALLVAPSGVGKSVISTQLLVPWTLGRPGLVGSVPLFPLRISIIQAEDDDTEMGEFRRDHRLGHVAEGYTLDEIYSAERQVFDMSPYFRGKTGDEFIRGLDFALRRHPSDVVILNPLQSYAGVDLNKNADLSCFLRNALDPVLNKQRAFMLCIHHTNKPQIDKSKGGAWGEDELSAYVGAGGAELTNYARSVTFIRRCTPKECGIKNSFMLIGAKRGNRLGWKDFDGNRTSRRIIAYSEDYLHWRVPTKEEVEAANGGAVAPERSSAADMTPEEAAAEIAAIIKKDWPNRDINHYCREKMRNRMARAVFSAGWQRLIANPAAHDLRIISDGPRSFHFAPVLTSDEPPIGDWEPQGDDDLLNDNDSQPY